MQLGILYAVTDEQSILQNVGSDLSRIIHQRVLDEVHPVPKLLNAAVITITLCLTSKTSSDYLIWIIFFNISSGQGSQRKNMYGFCLYLHRTFIMTASLCGRTHAVEARREGPVLPPNETHMDPILQPKHCSSAVLSQKPQRERERRPDLKGQVDDHRFVL